MSKINLIILLLLIPLISANELDCYLSPNYFQEGSKISYMNENSIPDYMNIDVYCSNLYTDQRILSLSFADASPEAFNGNLKEEKDLFLRINEKDKLLYSSNIFPIYLLNLTNDSIEFNIKIYGVTEKTMKFIETNVSKRITFPKKKDAIDFVQEIGKIIFPSSPTIGFFIECVIFLSLLYLIISHNFKDKLRKWKDGIINRRIKRKQEKEIWKNQMR